MKSVFERLQKLSNWDDIDELEELCDELEHISEVLNSNLQMILIRSCFRMKLQLEPTTRRHFRSVAWISCLVELYSKNS
jgi:hypothetical protein